MTTGVAGHIEDTVCELGGLANAPVDNGEGRIFVDIVRIEDEIFNSDVEVGRCILAWVFTVDQDIPIES